MAVAIAATAQDSWPPRVLVTVTGLTVGDVVTIYRTTSSTRTAVRGAEGVTVADTSLVRVDAELPFGVPVAYAVVVNDTAEYATGTTSYELTGGRVAITDAITGAAAEVVITSWPTRTRSRVSSSYAVGGRYVVVTGPLLPTENEIELLTESDSSRENLGTVLGVATSAVVQIRQAGQYPDVDGYYAVTSAQMTRYIQEGTDPRRVWTLSATEVEPWCADLEALGFTYADVAADYTGLTYAAVASDYATYLAVAQGDYS